MSCCSLDGFVLILEDGKHEWPSHVDASLTAGYYSKFRTMLSP